jgi:hypothetical protein
MQGKYESGIFGFGRIEIISRRRPGIVLQKQALDRLLCNHRSTGTYSIYAISADLS